jgi:hypothetical protein
MIKNDPLRKIVYRAMAAVGVLMVFMLVMAFIPHANSGHSVTLTALSNVWFILAAISFILLLCLLPLSLRVWKRVDARRELARQGDQSLLAREQPVANPYALQVPTVIRLRMKMRPLMLIMLPGIVGAVLILGVIMWVGNRGNLTALLILGIIVVVVLLISMGSMTLAMRRMKAITRYQVEVNEHGLIVLYNGEVTIINWQEAQVFAVSGINKPRRPRMYELSNPQIVARWMWLPLQVYPFYPLEPELPYDEYNRQMQALLEYIEAKTHLPLYDLTETTNKWYL